MQCLANALNSMLCLNNLWEVHFIKALKMNILKVYTKIYKTKWGYK